MGNLKILLADDHPLVRAGVRSVIETIGLASEIIEVQDGKQAVEMSLHNQIDLFILDYKMPVMDGFDAAKILLHKNPLCKIVIVTMYTDTVLILNLLKLGVLGFLNKNTNFDEVKLAISNVLKGERYVNRLLLEARMQREVDQFSKPLSPLKFTARETDLIILLSNGKTSKDISQSWGLSLKTIETYRSRLLEKIGVKNTAELLNYCNRNGLV